MFIKYLIGVIIFFYTQWNDSVYWFSWSSSYRRDLADSMNYFPVHRFKILSILFWKWPCESRPSNNSKESLVITNFMIDGNERELLKWKLLNDWFSPWWEGKVRKKCWKTHKTPSHPISSSPRSHFILTFVRFWRKKLQNWSMMKK